VETFEPKSAVKLLMAVFCGSDLDYDIWAKSQVEARAQSQRVEMTWSTVAPLLGKGDKVLSYRARLRGRAAGSAFPKMTLTQLDDVVSKRRLILDGEDIPNSHDFGEYYNDARLDRIVPVMLYLANPGLPKPLELAELDKILEAPADAASLTPFLDSGRYGTLFYTLWRLERLNCGDARHMTDGTLETIARLLKEHPQMIWKEQKKTECVTVQRGEFPSVRMMTRAGAPPRARRD
jgi:hypothetical protein